MEKTTIIIPTKNRHAELEKCLSHIFRNTAKGSFDVIVIDSSDNKFKTKFSIAYHHKKMSCGAAKNFGAAKAKTKLVCFVDDDILVKKGWLPPLVHEMKKHRKIGVLGSRILDPKGNIWSNGVIACADGRIRHITHDTKKGICFVSYCPGACIIVKRKLFRKIRFNDMFPGEDVDLCFQAWSLGYKVACCEKSVVIHDISEKRASSIDLTKRAHINASTLCAAYCPDKRSAMFSSLKRTMLENLKFTVKHRDLRYIPSIPYVWMGIIKGRKHYNKKGILQIAPASCKTYEDCTRFLEKLNRK